MGSSLIAKAQLAALDRYKALPKKTKEDVVEASLWARSILASHEGPGHNIQVSHNHPDMVVCSFSQPPSGRENTAVSQCL